METRELYERLRREKVWVNVVEGKLHLTGPAQALTPGLVEAIKPRRNDLVAFLLSPGPAPADPVRTEEKEYYPMQFIQRGRYAMYKLMPACTNPVVSKEIDTFNINNFYVYSHLDTGSLSRAFATLVERYEIL